MNFGSALMTTAYRLCLARVDCTLYNYSTTQYKVMHHRIMCSVDVNRDPSRESARSEPLRGRVR